MNDTNSTGQPAASPGLAEATGSALSLEDARTVCEMEAVCYSEGIGPDSTSLLKQICRQHPELVREFRFLNWPNTPVTDAEPSTPANTRAQGPRSV